MGPEYRHDSDMVLEDRGHAWGQPCSVLLEVPSDKMVSLGLGHVHE